MIVNRLMLVLVLIAAKNSVSAQNLVANGGFEQENICTEYTKNCAPEAWIATSLTSNYYFDDAPSAHEGRHFAGLIAGHLRSPLIRTFLCSRLLCALRKGNRYTIEFFIRSRHPLQDSIGVYFSSNSFMYERRSFRQMSPLLLISDVNSKLSKEWKKISLNFTSTGEENFIAIGSFKKTDYLFNALPDDGWHYYFFIDDLRVTPQDPNEAICSGADSLKAIIYNEDERHTLLEKKRYLYSRTPPQIRKASSTLYRKVDTLIIPDILFASGSYTLVPESHNLLDKFYSRIKILSIDSLVVEGHTDSIGTLGYNEKLSLNRARSVAQYIVSKFPVYSNPVSTRGFANRRPVATNANTTGRQKNRRVELYVFSKE